MSSQATLPADAFSVLGVPRSIQLETTGKCNLRCKMCAPQGIPGPDGKPLVKRGHMDADLYRKIVSDLAQYRDQIQMLSLFMDGDPLVDRLLPERVRYAKELGIRLVRIATNGMLLRGKMAEDLLHSGLDSIIVSIDSLDPETYAAIRIGGNLQQIERNVDEFMRMRKEAGRARPQVDVRMIQMPENAGEKDAFAAHWANRADSVIFHQIHNWGTTMGEQGSMDNAGSPCNWPFRDMVIYSDGRAGFCCLDFEGVYDLGDFRFQTLEEIWHGPAYTELRDNIVNWNVDQLPKCRECNHGSIKPMVADHWNRLLINNRTLEPVAVALEYEQEGQTKRSAARTVGPQSVFPWGIRIREGRVTVIDPKGQRTPVSVDLHPADTYYDVDIG